MSTGYAQRLYWPANTLPHRLPSQCKLASAVLFVFIVVATPPDVFWAFAVYAGLLATVVGLARIPPRLVLKRMSIELPFVLFAVLVPFVSRGPQTEILGVTVSSAGLLAAWNILIKASLGVVAAITLAGTTQPRDILRGAERLHLPPLLAQIAMFMLRYIDLILDDLRRMRIARESRGFAARGPRAWVAMARTAGALFVRSYERGERVYLAMLSRGYTGRMPAAVGVQAQRQHWMMAGLLPVTALAVLLVARIGLP